MELECSVPSLRTTYFRIAQKHFNANIDLDYVKGVEIFRGKGYGIVRFKAGREDVLWIYAISTVKNFTLFIADLRQVINKARAQDIEIKMSRSLADHLKSVVGEMNLLFKPINDEI